MSDSPPNLPDQPDLIFSPLFGDKIKTVVPSYGLDPTKMSTAQATYHSYAGTDISALMVLPGEKEPLVLGELQTISYSLHRENTPVRTLGHVNPVGFVKGPRTLAGSLIFTQFNQYAFYRLSQYTQYVNKGLYPLADMLPPFDVVLSFVNESGSFSKMAIHGVSIIDEGTTMSVDDLITEQTYTWMGKGIQPLTSYVPSGMISDTIIEEQVGYSIKKFL